MNLTFRNYNDLVVKIFLFCFIYDKTSFIFIQEKKIKYFSVNTHKLKAIRIGLRRCYHYIDYVYDEI